jgi:hypothetical protein
MVLLRLGDVQQLAGLPAVAELGHTRIAARVGPVEEQPPVGREVGVKGEPEQPPLGADRDLAREVDDRAAPPAAPADDAAGLLEHPQRARVAGGHADPGRSVEAGRDALDVERMGAPALGRRLRPVDAGQRIAQAADRHRGRRERRDDGDGHDQAGAH